jgi:hypothetical protein
MTAMRLNKAIIESQKNPDIFKGGVGVIPVRISKPQFRKFRGIAQHYRNERAQGSS